MPVFNRVQEVFDVKKELKCICNMHKTTYKLMYIFHEISKNITKSGFCRKKCLQNPLFYYIIVKRGMTYDDVGGYQSQ